MNPSPLKHNFRIFIILAVLIIIVGGVVYFSNRQTLPPSVDAPKNGNAISGQGTGVAVSPYDFNASGCVGDEGDLQALKGMCPAGGACNVMGESDPIQAALKFADAEKMYPCN